MLQNTIITVKIFDKQFTDSTHVYGLHRYDAADSRTQVIHNNYRAIRSALQAKELLILKHVHGSTVIDADLMHNLSLEPEADAAVTTKPSIALSVQTADCVPILLTAEDGTVIGAAHCGWRSAKDNLLAHTVELMRSKGAQKITALIGPAIHQHTYEVDMPFYTAIITSDAKADTLFIPADKPEHYFFDLPAFCRLKLHQLDIMQITDLCENTYENPDKYYSYRRGIHQKNPRKHTNILSCIMINVK